MVGIGERASQVGGGWGNRKCIEEWEQQRMKGKNENQLPFPIQQH